MMKNSYNEDRKSHQREAIRVDDVRNTEVYADLYQFTPAISVKNSVIDLTNYYNNDETFNTLHPVSRATWLFYELITIHPFMNGNGRLCRLFLAWSVMRDGFPFPVSFSSGHKKRRQHYIHAIEFARRPSGNKGELNVILLLSMERVLGNYMENKRLNAIANHPHNNNESENQYYYIRKHSVVEDD